MGFVIHWNESAMDLHVFLFKVTQPAGAQLGFISKQVPCFFSESSLFLPGSYHSHLLMWYSSRVNKHIFFMAPIKKTINNILSVSGLPPSSPCSLSLASTQRLNTMEWGENITGFDFNKRTESSLFPFYTSTETTLHQFTYSQKSQKFKKWTNKNHM